MNKILTGIVCLVFLAVSMEGVFAAQSSIAPDGADQTLIGQELRIPYTITCQPQCNQIFFKESVVAPDYVPDPGKSDALNCEDLPGVYTARGASGNMISDELVCPPNNRCHFVVCYYSVKTIPPFEWENPKMSNVFRLDTKDPIIDHESPTVWVSGSPVDWVSINQTAGVGCTDNKGCNTNSFRLLEVSQGDPCPTSYLAYPLTPPYTVSYHSWYCAAASDIGIPPNWAFSSPTEFKVDTGKPQAWITGFDPSGEAAGVNWTGTVFTVSWDGFEAETSIDYFRMQYMVEGPEPQGWTEWTIPRPPDQDAVFGPYLPETVITVKEGHTYSFQVKAIDSTGNEGDWSDSYVVKIDTGGPNCSIERLLPYVDVGFMLNWTATDGMGSGVKLGSLEVEFQTDGMVGWIDIFDSGVCTMNPDGKSADCSMLYMGMASQAPYYFRCRATDNAGNVGNHSPIVQTTKDGYHISFMDPLPDWMGKGRPQWSAAKNAFIISWNGTYYGAPIVCYNVRWTNNPNPNFINPADPMWKKIMNETNGTCLDPAFRQAIFGDEPDEPLVDGVNYTFIVRGIDALDKTENWPTVYETERWTTTIIDTVPPLATMQARDQDGNLLGDEPVSGAQVSSITIDASARDDISGILNNTIVVHVTTSFADYWMRFPCGESPPGVTGSCSTTDFPEERISFAEDHQVEYRLEVSDRAWNRNDTEWKFVVTHPLANFMVRDLFLTMGASYKGRIQVRNLAKRADDITLRFTGPYQFAWFEDEEGQTMQEIIVQDLPPGEITTVDFLLGSAEPGDYELRLNAYSSLPASVTDEDSITIRVGFPSDFPGLEPWAIMFLVLLAGIVFWKWMNLDQRSK